MTKKNNFHPLIAAIFVGLVLLMTMLRRHPLGILIAISIIIYTLIFFIRNPNFKWNSGYWNEWIKIRRLQQALILPSLVCIFAVAAAIINRTQIGFPYLSLISLFIAIIAGEIVYYGYTEKLKLRCRCLQKIKKPHNHLPIKEMIRAFCWIFGTTIVFVLLLKYAVPYFLKA